MSSHSRDYYNTSRGSETYNHSLPPIRDVVGDELDRRARPNPYTFGDVRGALPTHHGLTSRSDQRGPTLPPIQHSEHTSRSSAYHGSSGTRDRYSSEHASSSQPQRSGHSRAHASDDPSYTYGVLRVSSTSSGTLVHATPPSVVRPHGILRQAPTQVYDDDPDKKHKCEYCGKKFDRPSSLQVHLRTHTGSQPFACEWPGCDRTFSVRSNMLRHLRSHEKNSSSHRPYAGQGGNEDEDQDDDQGADYFRTASNSSGGQPSASHYYSSSRRK